MFENHLKALIFQHYQRKKVVEVCGRQDPILVKKETFLWSFQTLCDYRSTPHFVFGNLQDGPKILSWVRPRDPMEFIRNVETSLSAAAAVFSQQDLLLLPPVWAQNVQILWKWLPRTNYYSIFGFIAVLDTYVHPLAELQPPRLLLPITRCAKSVQKIHSQDERD